MKNIEAQTHTISRTVVNSFDKERVFVSEDVISGSGTEKDFADTKMSYNESKNSHNNHIKSPKKSFGFPDENRAENINGDLNSNHDADIEDDDVLDYLDQCERSSWDSYQDHPNLDNSNKNLLFPQDTEKKLPYGTVIPVSPQSNKSCLMREQESTLKAGNDLNRSAFRTPSSVRAIQMSSPFELSSSSSSPSIHRISQSISRGGTPRSYELPSRESPSRLKPNKEDPLVLLHLTLMPLNYSYSCLMSSPKLPESLKGVRESWRQLQDKLGETVLDRGVLLAHPQDSYEALEERLLEALELPTCPRVRILKCGHYMRRRSSSSDTADSEERNCEVLLPIKSRNKYKPNRKWCDICRRNTCFPNVGESEKFEKRFRIKIFASNGLMSAGAWAAAWREMERVDVEIEPYVDANLHTELERFASLEEHITSSFNEHDINEYEDDEIIKEISENHDFEHDKGEEELKIEAEIREHEKREEMCQSADREEEWERESEIFNDKIDTKCEEEKEEIQKHETYKNEALSRPKPDSRYFRSNKLKHFSDCNQDSLLDLIIASIKVVLLEKRNLIISLMAVLVALIFLMSQSSLVPPPANFDPNVTRVSNGLTKATSSLNPNILTKTIIQEITVTKIIPAPSSSVVKDINSQLPTAASLSKIYDVKVNTQEKESMREIEQFRSLTPSKHANILIETHQSDSETENSDR